MNLSERVKAILLKPKQEWQTNSRETTTLDLIKKVLGKEPADAGVMR